MKHFLMYGFYYFRFETANILESEHIYEIVMS